MSDGGNGQEWVLARGYCAYTVLDGSAVPPRKRRGFIDMAVSRWSPFADAQSHVEWVGDRAMVWAWSKARALAGPDDTILPAPRRTWPESLFRGQPLPEGEELVALDEGVEARAWRDGVMTASRWWAEAPDLPEWNEFRRGAGLPPAAALPAQASYPLGEGPWTAQKAIRLGEALGHYREYLIIALVGVGAAVLATLLVGVLALKVSNWQLDQDIAEREQALEKIIDARDRAQQARAAIDARLALRPPAGQVELLALVSGLMRGNWQLIEWKMADAQTLEVTAKMVNADPSAIVSAWEASKRFTEVTAEIGRQPDTVVVKARILRAMASGGSRK
ncbi:MAG TPA: hypothetical protein VLC71_12140 [Thermomonas sp.]|nr:hypothetical protein [Thermomonas sp.]